MLNDLFISLQWWVVLFGIGILFFPLTAFLFPKFIDRGYAFSKSLGVLFLSYAMLVTGTLHLLSFSALNLILLLIFFGSLMFFLTRTFSLPLSNYRSLLKSSMLWIFVEEVLFLLILVLWAYIRSFSPDINGLEKFMDFGFVNSILRTEYFPAKDMWFAPFTINYYYFGHFVTAVLTKLSFLSSSYTYNLMIATIAGLTFAGSFSIGLNLYEKLVEKKNLLKLFFAGVLTAAIVTFAGNIHTLYTLFKPYENDKPVPFWELTFSPQTFPNAYWYPNATRFIHNTIHEFPIYSWTVSDLHGHVTDIPFVLLTIGFILSLFYSYSEREKRKTIKLAHKNNRFGALFARITSELPLSFFHMLTLSLLLAVMYMTNAWDGLIYLLLAILLIAYLEWRKIKLLSTPFLSKIGILILELVIPVVVLGGGFLLFSLPFSLFFKPFVSGVGILCAPEFLTTIGKIGPLLFEADHCQRSPLWQLGILYGFFYFFIIVLGIMLIRTKKLLPTDIFIIMLTGLSTFLILVPEFIYAKDIYPAHYRANTMFKLVFQAFIMLSIVTGYSISRISLALKQKRTIGSKILYGFFFIVSLMLLTGVFVYPYFAIFSYYGELKTYRGLNGTAYLRERYPDDAKAITWLSEHVQNQPVILEAQGDSYTDYARVSANTGFPTVLGWTVHEWLWRGTYDIPAPRIDEIKQVYESEDQHTRQELLKKYNVSYIFLGELERQKYNVNDAAFSSLGSIVYQSGATKVFKLK